MNFDWEPMTVTICCKTCGSQFQAYRAGTLGPVHCDPCIDRREADYRSEHAAKMAEYREKKWAEHCPPQFRTLAEGGCTDPNRLRLEQRAFPDVMSWQFGPKGLLLIGETGKGKTRCAWRLLRREFEAGRSVKAITAVRFDVETQEFGGGRGFKAWFDGLAKADLLFVDDVGKGRWTDHVESRFFGLIDERTSECRPTIVTSNDTGATLEARLSEHRGSALVRRLREYAHAIVLK